MSLLRGRRSLLSKAQRQRRTLVEFCAWEVSLYSWACPSSRERPAAISVPDFISVKPLALCSVSDFEHAIELHFSRRRRASSSTSHGKICTLEERHSYTFPCSLLRRRSSIIRPEFPAR